MFRALACAFAIFVGGCVLPPKSEPMPKTHDEQEAWLKRWSPVHARAVKRHGAQILQCEQLEMKLVGMGRLETMDDVDTRITTSWTAEGCERAGAWLVYCPPLPALGVPSVRAGQIACSVKQKPELLQQGTMPIVTDEGGIVVVDDEIASAPATTTDYPDD